MSLSLQEEPLRFRRMWQAIGALLILLVVYLSLTPDPIDLPVRHGDKYGHVLAYATLMFWFAMLHRPLASRVGWAVAFVTMSVALEHLQRLTGYRTFDAADIMANASGVCVGWLLAPPRLPNGLVFVETRLFQRSENLDR